MEVKYPLKVSTIQYTCPKCGNFMVAGDYFEFNKDDVKLTLHTCSSTTCSHAETLNKVYPYIHYEMAIEPETPGGTITFTLNQNK